MSDFPHPILIVTGMHRSGTSLTASLLQSAGVDMGSNLMGPIESNMKGHFEDLEVVQFHESVLEACNFPPQGWVTQEKITEIPENLRIRAQEIIASKRKKAGITGWKDPRGTLFLEFWQSQVPEAKFIFVYRTPWEVIDSLYRRGDHIFQEFPYLALEFWISYNSAILSFCNQYPHHSILFNIDQIRHNPQVLGQAIHEKFQLSLAPQSEIYDVSLFHNQVSQSSRPAIIQEFFPEAITIFQHLEHRCYYTRVQSDSYISQQTHKQIFDEKSLFQDWLKLRTAEKVQKENQLLLSDMQQYNQELESTVNQTNEELKQIKKEQNSLIQEWENAQQCNQELESTINQTNEELKQIKKEQDSLIQEWENAQQCNQELESTINQTNEELKQIKKEQDSLIQEWENAQQCNQELESTINQTNEELKQIKKEQDSLIQEWENAQQCNQELESTINQTNEELKQIKKEQDSLIQEWENAQFQLEKALQGWEETQNLVQAMKSSKFWKLRQLWFQIKHRLGLPIK
ncbi:MAG: hypothetical protein GVY04_08455 [Cyanobacteria bacterium]|jgi:inorganic pyrophosphatase|nr:hypothetical protein [Cyanobacteria bacterium GSL.Bin1]